MDETQNNSKEIVIKLELPQVVNAAFMPLANAIGETLGHGWRGMTMGVETWCGKKEIDKDINLKLYKEALENNLSKIAESNLQEPSMNIVGPCLDASKFYFEDKQYRDMFANLIASSCDKSKNPYIHPAFVEFIKQMTSLEGKILRDLDTSNLYLLNIVDTSNGIRRQIGLIPSVVNKYEASIYELNTALVNLNRLELIQLPNLSSLIPAHEDIDLIKSSKLYSLIIESISAELPDKHEIIVLPFEITNTGKNFLKVCIE